MNNNNTVKVNKKPVKHYKILRTFCEGYENPKEEKGYLSGVFASKKECEARIEEFLEDVYGEDWKEFHGDDLTTDSHGFPFYQTDIGDGGYEILECVEFNRRK